MASIDLNTRGKRPAFFGDGDVDALVTALLESMAQQWATRERLLALEKLMVARGLLKDGELEAFVLPDSDAQQLAADQQTFLQDAFRSLGANFEGLADREQSVNAFQKT